MIDGGFWPIKSAQPTGRIAKAISCPVGPIPGRGTGGVVGVPATAQPFCPTPTDDRSPFARGGFSCLATSPPVPHGVGYFQGCRAVIPRRWRHRAGKSVRPSTLPHHWCPWPVKRLNCNTGTGRHGGWLPPSRSWGLLHELQPVAVGVLCQAHFSTHWIGGIWAFDRRARKSNPLAGELCVELIQVIDKEPQM